MSVYLTGDIHGRYKEIETRWRNLTLPTFEDILIILGDFGILNRNLDEEYETSQLKEIASKPWITAFIDGNHDNHPRLYKLPQVPFCGGNAGEVIENKLYHLKRGEIYTFQNKTFFTFGGANSIDALYQLYQGTWWKEEIASVREMDYGLNTLETHENKIDYILAHTAPEDIARLFVCKFNKYGMDTDPTRKYLDHICSNVKFKGFYCGHWHRSWKYNKYHFLYKKVIKLT